MRDVTELGGPALCKAAAPGPGANNEVADDCADRAADQEARRDTDDGREDEDEEDPKPGPAEAVRNEAE